MDTRNFDKEIKQALEGAEMVPSAQVWERIQAAGEMSDKKPLLFWIASAIIVSLLVLAAFVAVRQQMQSADVNSASYGSEIVDQSATMKEYGGNPMQATRTSEPNVGVEKIDASQNEAESVDANLNSSSQSKGIKPVEALSSDKATEKTSSKKIGVAVTKENYSKSQVDVFPTMNRTNELAKNSTVTSHVIQKGIIQNKMSDAGLISEASEQRSLLGLTMTRLETTKIGFLASQTANNSIEIDEFKLLKDCYHFNPKPSRFFMDMFLGGNAAWHTLSSDESDLAGHLEERENSEMVKSSYSLGIRVGGKVYNDFFVRTGFEYTRIDEDFEHIEQTLISEVFIGINRDSLWDVPTEQWIITEDSIFQRDYDTKRLASRNHYEILSIPLDFGHQWENKRFTYGVFGGVAVNIAFDRQGTVLGAGEELTVNFNPASTESDPMFRDRLGLRLNAGVYGAYEVFQDVHIFAEPRFASYIKPITLADQAVQKKFQFVGANFGVRFDL